MNYIDIFIDNKHYIQRNQFSKIIEISKGKKSIFDNLTELPRDVREIIGDIIEVKENIDKYFRYEIINENEIKITEYLDNENIQNMMIPEYINNCLVTKLDFTFEYTPIKRIMIPESITELPDYFCTTCRNLEEVHLSSKIKEISYSCFASCYKLKRINLGNIECIQNESFANCYELEKINLQNLKETGLYSFCWCKSLRNIHAPNLVFVDDYTFSHCEDLRTIELSKNTINIGRCAFENCKKLYFINLSNGLTEIEPGTFRSCENLTEIKFPKFLKKIKYNAFKNSGLQKINLPNTLTIIEDGAFEGSNLQIINMSKNTKYEHNSFSLEQLSKINLYDTIKGKIKDIFIKDR